MLGSHKTAFTLVEILIVVVILGILAAIVIPQFTSATTQAARSQVSSQLQSIEKQIEMYRGQNQGTMPLDDLVDPMVEGGSNGGWGILVSGNYMKEAPMNVYTGSTVVVAGNEAAALGETKESANGWYYEVLAPGLTVHAAGFNRGTQQLEHEYNP